MLACFLHFVFVINIMTSLSNGFPYTTMLVEPVSLGKNIHEKEVFNLNVCLAFCFKLKHFNGICRSKTFFSVHEYVYCDHECKGYTSIFLLWHFMHAYLFEWPVIQCYGGFSVGLIK